MKIFILLLLMLSIGNIQAAEPNFNLVGAVKQEKDLDILFPAFVGTGSDLGDCRMPRPAGEGWEWDKERKLWWRYSQEITLPQLPNSGCPIDGCKFPSRSGG